MNFASDTRKRKKKSGLFVNDELKGQEKGNQIYLQPVFMKSFKLDALCVPLARDPNAIHRAVSIALFPPTEQNPSSARTKNKDPETSDRGGCDPAYSRSGR